MSTLRARFQPMGANWRKTQGKKPQKEKDVIEERNVRPPQPVAVW
jgi:hypothetical protein